ncbi:MAG: hypothetical protein HQM12_22780, partial [SAR324 cluster bacterium]|nr:hypothetical protein [SAR324 cluster bacterium]
SACDEQAGSSGPEPVTGTARAIGGTEISTFWNGSNQTLRMEIPIGNDPELSGGSLKILISDGGESFTDLTPSRPLSQTDLNTTVILDFPENEMESHALFSEGAVWRFKAEIANRQGLSTQGDEFPDLLRIDQTPSETILTFQTLGAVPRPDVWNRTSESLEIAIDLTRDPGLLNGTIQLEAFAGDDDWTPLGEPLEITGQHVLDNRVVLNVAGTRLEPITHWSETAPLPLRALIRDGAGNLQTFLFSQPLKKDLTQPRLVSVIGSGSSKQALAVFSEPVYGDVQATEKLSSDALSYQDSGGPVTRIEAISHQAGDTNARVTLNTIPEADDVELDQFLIEADQIFDQAGNTADVSQSTRFSRLLVTPSLTDRVLPKNSPAVWTLTLGGMALEALAEFQALEILVESLENATENDFQPLSADSGSGGLGLYLEDGRHEGLQEHEDLPLRITVPSWRVGSPLTLSLADTRLEQLSTSKWNFLHLILRTNAQPTDGARFRVRLLSVKTLSETYYPENQRTGVWTLDALPPKLESLTLALTEDQTPEWGETVSLKPGFSEPVRLRTVCSASQPELCLTAKRVLKLETGATDRFAVWDNTTTLSDSPLLTYTVQSGDTAQPLKTATLSLTEHALITDEAGNALESHHIPWTLPESPKAMVNAACVSQASGDWFTDTETVFGSLNCRNPQKMFVIRDGHTITWDDPDQTLTGDIRLETGGTLVLTGTAQPVTATLILAGGTLKIKDDVTWSGTIRHERSSGIDIESYSTLTTTGPALTLGSGVLTISGGGLWSNTEPVTLDDAQSGLRIQGYGTHIRQVVVSENITNPTFSARTLNAKTITSARTLRLHESEQPLTGIVVESHATLDNLSLGRDITVDASGGSLTIAQTLNILPAARVRLTLNGSVTARNLVLNGSLDLNGDTLELTSDASLLVTQSATLGADGDLVFGGTSTIVSGATLTLADPDTQASVSFKGPLKLDGQLVLAGDENLQLEQEVPATQLTATGTGHLVNGIFWNVAHSRTPAMFSVRSKPDLIAHSRTPMMFSVHSGPDLIAHSRTPVMFAVRSQPDLVAHSRVPVMFRVVPAPQTTETFASEIIMASGENVRNCQQTELLVLGQNDQWQCGLSERSFSTKPVPFENPRNQTNWTTLIERDVDQIKLKFQASTSEFHVWDSIVWRVIAETERTNIEANDLGLEFTVGNLNTGIMLMENHPLFFTQVLEPDQPSIRGFLIADGVLRPKEPGHLLLQAEVLLAGKTFLPLSVVMKVRETPKDKLLCAKAQWRDATQYRKIIPPGNIISGPPGEILNKQLDDEFFACSLEGVAAGKICHPQNNLSRANDAILFNALLCASGEDLGCDAVRRSQDAQGRWWRSPMHKGNEHATDTASFSKDHALGVLLYLAAVKEKPGYDARGQALAWQRYMLREGGEQAVEQVLEVGKEIVREYAELITQSRECVSSDLLTLDQLNSCGTFVEEYVEQWQDLTNEELIACGLLSVAIPPILPVCPAIIDELTRKKKVTVKEKVLQWVTLPLPKVCDDSTDCAIPPDMLILMNDVWLYLGLPPLINQLKTLNAPEVILSLLNESFQSGSALLLNGSDLHLKAVEVLLRQKIGISYQLLLNAVLRQQSLIDGDSLNNPFYEFLRNGYTDSIAEDILEKCQYVSLKNYSTEPEDDQFQEPIIVLNKGLHWS